MHNFNRFDYENPPDDPDDLPSDWYSSQSDDPLDAYEDYVLDTGNDYLGMYSDEDGYIKPSWLKRQLSRGYRLKRRVLNWLKGNKNDSVDEIPF